MAKSLQEQLLGSGMINKDQLKKAKKNKHLQQKQKKSRNSQVEIEGSSKKLNKDKVAKDKFLNQKRQQELEEKALHAQIVQLIESHKQPLDTKADINYHFLDNKVIKKIYVSLKQQQALAIGSLSVAKLNASYQLLPSAVADKINARANGYIIETIKEEQPAEEDDYYSQYKIPDDLIW